jgi:hypothetical protein
MRQNSSLKMMQVSSSQRLAISSMPFRGLNLTVEASGFGDSIHATPGVEVPRDAASVRFVAEKPLVVLETHPYRAQW